MSIQLDRAKPTSWFLRIMYKLARFLPMTNLAKFKLFLNLEWFFDRIAHEYSIEKNNIEIVHAFYIHGFQKMWCKVRDVT
jgi:hypothetical protein